MHYGQELNLKWHRHLFPMNIPKTKNATNRFYKEDARLKQIFRTKIFILCINKDFHIPTSLLLSTILAGRWMYKSESTPKTWIWGLLLVFACSKHYLSAFTRTTSIQRSDRSAFIIKFWTGFLVKVICVWPQEQNLILCVGLYVDASRRGCKQKPKLGCDTCTVDRR